MSYKDALMHLIDKANREHDTEQAHKLAELLRLTNERGNK